MQIKHLENGEWVEVRQNKLSEAFDHAVAHGSQFDSGLYKITTNSAGHVTAASKVTREDLVNFGLLDSNSVASTYDRNSTYVAGEYCIYNGKLYKALENCGEEQFDSSKWEQANILITASSGGLVVSGEADWNAEEGDAGYIKNKPNISQSGIFVFDWIVDVSSYPYTFTSSVTAGEIMEACDNGQTVIGRLLAGEDGHKQYFYAFLLALYEDGSEQFCIYAEFSTFDDALPKQYATPYSDNPYDLPLVSQQVK